MSLEEYYEKLTKEYAGRTTKSGIQFEKAKKYLAGGETRTVSYYPPYPLTIDYGKGYEIFDLDGNRYVDFINNYTSLIHGHANDKITEAIQRAAAKGTAVPAGIEEQVALAELICTRVPCAERIRFCNSGTEATLFAVRAAKAYTGKDGIIKMLGGYHGTTDMMEYNVSLPKKEYASVEEMCIPAPDIKGVSSRLAEEMYIVPFNRLEAVEKVLAESADKIAALIMEPFLGAGGLIPAEEAYVKGVRELTEKYHVLLIFDEVQALRLSEGGAQKRYGVVPDIAAFGKIIGGGLPVGAVAGKEEIMEVFNPVRKDALTQSGTFNGNRVTMAAGYASLIQYNQAACDRLEQLAERAEQLMEEAFAKTGITGCVTRAGSLMNYHFLEKKPTCYEEGRNEDKMLFRLMHLEMLKRGFFVAPRGMIALSTPMDEVVIDAFGNAFHDSLSEIKKVYS